MSISFRALTWVTLAGLVGGGCVINSKSTTEGSGGGNASSADTTTSTTAATTSSGGGEGGAGGGTTTATGTGGAGGGMTCTPSDPNDTCSVCANNSCCAEITACDDTCLAMYEAYSSCLYDANGPTGYNSNYCKLNVGADDPSTPGADTPAGALIGCLETSCYNDGACGAEPAQPTFTNFAAEFIEVYCVGCHTDHYQSPNNGVETAQYRDPDAFGFWDGPKIAATWLQEMDYDRVVQDGDMLWCGISAELPAECENMFPGKFPNAKRFPPAGAGVNNLHCWWVSDPNLACEQPTDADRAQMMNWIFAGYPQ